MKRFHVHLNVRDLDTSIRFYSTLFASEPSVRKPDYAKWMLDDPYVNFAISARERALGIDHLGIQLDDAASLEEMGSRLDAAGAAVLPEQAVVCCYARSDKVWSEDPQGVRWETFLTHAEATTWHAGQSACATDGSSCTPDVAQMKAHDASTGSCCAPNSGCC